ncbi:MAG TPA: membrane dipeptidase [Burkholderiaceae bacterium]|nr:membrane dipeptidase [Burkholderiaceae bacterium]
MKSSHINRRGFGLAALGAMAGAAAPGWAQPARRLMADMHSHYAMWNIRFPLDLPGHMRETGATLLAWSIVDDTRWTTRTRQGLRQQAAPEPGELWAYFQQEVTRANARLDEWKLHRALAPADVDAALAGEPRIVLATEGANFLEGRPERVALAHAAGVRHLQLVHYIQSPLGDHQTVEPRHGGLTQAGAQVIAECQRLGLVVDLAHGTEALVNAALDASEAAPVWSHSWISPRGGSWQDPAYIARALSPQSARKIAARGGVVGLWSVRVIEPAYPLKDVASYADEIMRMADLIGPKHVAFGTDMSGAGPNPILSNYVDLREVAENLARRGLGDSALNDILIGNYARVLKKAMGGAQR